MAWHNFVTVSHVHLIKTLARNPSLYNNLLTLYSGNPSTLPSALKLFDRLPFSPTVASWTSIISSTSSHSPLLSFQFFLSMLRSSTFPNQRAIASLLSHHHFLTPQLHSLSLKLSQSNLPFAGSALIAAYAKCGNGEGALKVFDRIQIKDDVCYGAAITGLVRCKNPVYALKVFACMRDAGVYSNEVSVSSALRAAAELSALEQTRMIHGHTIVNGLERSSVVIGTALVSTYGKAGEVGDNGARKVFDSMLAMNIFTWNSMIAGYGQHGDWRGASEVFDLMQCANNVKCDDFTFLFLLTSFSNAGLVVETQIWLNKMESQFGVKPNIKHHTCLIGAMARTGEVEAALLLTTSMPFEPDETIWRTLLTACVSHRKTEMGRVVFERLVELNPLDKSAYLMLSNLHAIAGEPDEATGIKKSMKNLNMKGDGGRSWVEVQGEVHMFTASENLQDGGHKCEIMAKVVELMERIKRLGYVGSEDRKLWYHSEKLAVGFGLLIGELPTGKTLRVVNNLRICPDCHEYLRHVSLLVERRIVVRDVNRFHIFDHGRCSCNGIW
ncbi:Pentatricopeptide repeat protein 77 [Zostera marina]|uniref:Pentatricopeptide repeat protein 77 n=1 Tax=Zostera marina TaxID=29655 RepID=A0A0K9P8U7_ZOSMR|nr:Pentatricopeptide repeat protein 77 [Zostera marina]